MSEQHAKFLERLKQSSRAVFAVAWYQHRKGRRVEIPPLRFAPDASQHQEYVDEGDLYVWLGEQREQIEVKGLTINFTGLEDYPYKMLMVGNVASVDRAGDVLCRVAVSQDMTHAAIAHRHTRPDWQVVTGLVKNTGNVESNYGCPLRLVQFVKLRDAI